MLQRAQRSYKFPCATHDIESNNPAPAFESCFAEWAGAKYAISCNSGTSALHAALYACGVGPGYKVAMPALNVVMTAFVTRLLGAEPIFVDVDENNFVLNLNISNVKAVVPVSLYGCPLNFELANMSPPQRPYIVHDNAQNFAKPSGADITMYSLEKKKHVTSGSEGGMLVTDNAGLAKRARQFAGLGYSNITAGGGATRFDDPNPDFKRFAIVAPNYRMSEVQAKVGMADLNNWQREVEWRQSMAGQFREAMNGCNFFRPQLHHAEHTYWTFAAEYTGRVPWQDFHDQFVRLGGEGFYAAPLLPYQEEPLKEWQRDCPIAERLQKNLMLFKTRRLTGQMPRSAQHKQAIILKDLIDSLS